MSSVVEKIQPEKIAELLKCRGMNITVEQAKVIIEFLRKIAGIFISNNI